MASVIDSVEENSFDHFIEIKLGYSRTYFPVHSSCINVDRFTDQIYVIFVNIENRGFDHEEMWDLLIYSQSGEFLRSFSHGKKMEAIYGFLHFKVADSISLIGCNNDRGSGIGEFMGARQLDISKEGDLFVADFGNNRVQILDCNLQYKRHISHHSMLKPRDVKLTPDEVYVSGNIPEQSTYCVHIFTYLGEKLRSIILNGILNRIPWRGFSVDTRGITAIIDYSTSQIKFFTKEGYLIEKFVTLKDASIFGRSKNIIGVTWMTNQKLILLSKDAGCGRL